MSGSLSVHAPDGAPEITAGADLAGLVVGLLAPQEGDIVVVTSKAVAKAEGLARVDDRDRVIAEETTRVVATTGRTRIVRTRHGLTMAAAGVDESNVAKGHLITLPKDPDGSARSLRHRIAELAGVSVAVVITDTAGRAWRLGQTDIAVGAAGLEVLESYAGRTDGYGNPLVVTAPAVADELAGAAELAQGKLTGRPFALIRGRADLVLPLSEAGPGAAALIRQEGEDLFGFGAREAVIRAWCADPADRRVFGESATAEELADALTRVGVSDVTILGPQLVRAGLVGAGLVGAGLVRAGAEGQAVPVVAFAHGWRPIRSDLGSVDLVPVPATARGADPTP